MGIIIRKSGGSEERAKKRKEGETQRKPKIDSSGSTSRVDDKEDGKSTKHLEEFLTVMKPKPNRAKGWQNEEISPPESAKKEKKAKSKREKPGAGDKREKTAKETDGVDEKELDDVEWMKRRMTSTLDAEMDDLDVKGYHQDEDEETAQVCFYAHAAPKLSTNAITDRIKDHRTRKSSPQTPQNKLSNNLHDYLYAI